MKNNALCFFGIALAFSGAGNVFAADTNNAPVKRGGAVTVTIISSLDGTEQKADFYCPPGAAPDGPGESVPLLVQLHIIDERLDWHPGIAHAMDELQPAAARLIVVADPIRPSCSRSPR